MSVNEPEPHPPLDPPLPATVGRYEVVRILGEGAMGRVLLAHDPVLDRDVAVKHLRGDLKIPRDVRQGLVARMRHEARAAARVAHPNLVVLHDMGEDPSVGLFLVFEYVEGPTLKQRIVADGRLPPAEAARLARELGAALTVAHEAGILHRDVKPENVMLARTGGKIADFGIARIPDSTLTHQGGLMGTPAYSAPETFRAGKFSPASDQFSLAASIYEAVSGRRAFPGDDAVTVAARIASDTPDRFTAELGLPPAVDEVLGRALDRRAEARYPSCEAFGVALSESLQGTATSEVAAAIDEGSLAPRPPDTSLPELPPAPPERRTGQVVLGALLVVATAMLVVRTALRPGDAAADRGATEPSVPTASARSGRPRPAPAAPLLARPPRSHSEPHAEATAAPSTTPAAPVADAGAASAEPASSNGRPGAEPPSPGGPAAVSSTTSPPPARPAATSAGP